MRERASVATRLGVFEKPHRSRHGLHLNTHRSWERAAARWDTGPRRVLE
jgi:hypothetical protein